MSRQAIRRHWTIKNSLHWVLDVVFREDEARSRDRVAPRNFAVLRTLAFNRLQQGALFDQLVAKGKNKKLALLAVCSKVLEQAFAIIKSGQRYQADLASSLDF